MDSPIRPEDIDEYWEKGFLVGVPIFSPEEVAHYRAGLQAIEAAEIEADGGQWLDRHDYPWKPGRHPVRDWFTELATHPKLLNAVAAVLGPNLLIRNGDVFIKEPGVPLEVNWHLDTAMCDGTEDGYLTAWIGLGEAPVDAQSGGLKFAVGGHRITLCEPPDSKAHLSLTERAREQVLGGEIFQTQMQPGELSLHHCRTPHFSGANATQDRRIGVVIRFLTPGVSAQAAESRAVKVVRGVDKSGRFIHSPYFPITWTPQVLPGTEPTPEPAPEAGLNQQVPPESRLGPMQDVASAHPLPPLQVDTYRNDGFTGPLTLLSVAQLADVQGAIQSWRDALPVNATDDQRDYRPWEQSDHALRDTYESLALNPALLGAIASLIGPNILVRSGVLSVLPPQRPAPSGWRVDDLGPLEDAAKVVHVRINLGATPMTAKTGGREFLHGRHLNTLEMSPNGPLFVARASVRALPRSARSQMTLQPGQALLHHPQVPHRDAFNHSEHELLCLDLVFMTPELTQQRANINAAALAHGKDTTGNFFLKRRFPVSAPAPGAEVSSAVRLRDALIDRLNRVRYRIQRRIPSH